jgi:hypothetical protein
MERRLLILSMDSGAQQRRCAMGAGRDIEIVAN